MENIINAINELKNEKDTIKARIVEIDQKLAEIRAAIPKIRRRQTRIALLDVRKNRKSKAQAAAAAQE